MGLSVLLKVSVEVQLSVRLEMLKLLIHKGLSVQLTFGTVGNAETVDTQGTVGTVEAVGTVGTKGAINIQGTFGTVGNVGRVVFGTVGNVVTQGLSVLYY
jgi:hypothetical protein